MREKQRERGRERHTETEMKGKRMQRRDKVEKKPSTLKRVLSMTPRFRLSPRPINLKVIATFSAIESSRRSIILYASTLSSESKLTPSLLD